VKTSYDSAASFLRGAEVDSAFDSWDWVSAAQDLGADISLQDAITALPDGSGRLEVVGGGFKRRDVRSLWVDLRPVRRRLSPEALAGLTALAEQSGTFDHAVGTWDQGPDGEEELFLHCQTLEMERVDAAGYRFSSVNIGCNQPQKLMPLVDEVIRLGGIGMVRGNWAGYSRR